MRQVRMAAWFYLMVCVPSIVLYVGPDSAVAACANRDMIIETGELVYERYGLTEEEIAIVEG